ncbi:MAG: Flp family type IVb pilin [Microthrixaceae bacterium]|nr:Flp family type IVb pilin [Microthrixaceae bacterium]MCO5314064.1 Flp family type IVb pilin [Microthrixaceae bacterium]
MEPQELIDNTTEALDSTDGSSHGLAASRSERGANLVEYALLLALIAIVCVAGVAALGETLPAGFSSVSGHL